MKIISLYFAKFNIGIILPFFTEFEFVTTSFAIIKYYFHPFGKSLLISKNKKANRGMTLVQVMMPSFTVLIIVSKAALFALLIYKIFL